MSLFPRRLVALIVKELLTLFRDPRVRLVLIAPPLLQLLVFSFAATLEVKNVSLAVVNDDAGKHSQELIFRISGSSFFKDITFLRSAQEGKIFLDEQKGIAVVHFPQNFSRRLEAGGQGRMQVLLDGRKSNAAQIVNSYLMMLASAYAEELLGQKPQPKIMPQLLNRTWFNENLLYLWATVPALMGILAMLITVMVTSLSVAREKELGTFDQLLVSPLLPQEILMGKAIPAVLIGFCEGLLIFLVSILFFRLPFTGSFFLLLFSLFIFVLSVVGLGLFISSLASTQQQAILGAFTLLVPAVTLSGFAAPVENMPEWLQTLSWLNPLKHALIIFRGLYLKELPFSSIFSGIWPLLLIGSLSLGMAGWLFTKKLE